MQDTTIRQCWRIERRAISFFKFIFEAYEGIAVIETLDGKSGTIALHIAPGCEEMVAGIIRDLGRNHLMEPVYDEDAK